MSLFTAINNNLNAPKIMLMLQQFGSAAVYGNILLLSSTFYSDKCIFIPIQRNRKKFTIPNHKQKHRNRKNQHLFQEITKSQLISTVFVPNTHLTMQNVGYCNWFSLFACNLQIFLSISRNKWSNYVDFSNLHWICQHITQIDWPTKRMTLEPKTRCCLCRVKWCDS